MRVLVEVDTARADVLPVENSDADDCVKCEVVLFDEDDEPETLVVWLDVLDTITELSTALKEELVVEELVDAGEMAMLMLVVAAVELDPVYRADELEDCAG